MEKRDSFAWGNELSHSSRPFLDDVVVAQFRRGVFGMCFKNGHLEKNFTYTDFLRKKFKKDIEEKSLVTPNNVDYRGISEERKTGIINTLLPLMPNTRYCFWKNILKTI